MYISTSTEPIDKVGSIENVLKMLKEVGFDAYDYSMFNSCVHTNIIDREDYIAQAEKIRRLADEIGLCCNQSHAPFPTWIKGDEEYNEKTFPRIVRAIEVTGILGGKLCVVHPWNNATPEENAEFYNKLLPYAKANNVKIGVENMWNWEEDWAADAACSSAENYLRHMALLDKDWFVVNLDLGHGDMMKHLGENAVHLISLLKERLEGLHIHDNDCHHDNHAIPFTMQMNYAEIIQALRSANYQGDVTLEIGQYKNMPVELYPAVMRFAAEVARYIRCELTRQDDIK